MHHATAAAAERAFYSALAAGDLEQMMALWADDDASVCTHPSGARQVGRQAIRSAYRQVFATGGLQIRTVALHAWSQGDVAVHSLIEQIGADPLGGEVALEQLATNVFVRTAQGWQILSHHATLNATLEIETDDDPEAAEALQFAASLERLIHDDEDDGEFLPRRRPADRLH